MKKIMLKVMPHIRRLIIWLLKKMVKFWKTSLTILIVLLTISWVTYLNHVKEVTAISSCQELYKARLEKFAEQTGITSENVEFGAPEIIKSKNMYKVNWNNTIEQGGEPDSFSCAYNFGTKSAINKTLPPKS